MPFSDTMKTFAFSPALVDGLLALTQDYGHPAHDKERQVVTLACGWDDEGHTKLRALDFPETAALSILSDGRVAFRALWTNDILNALGADARLNGVSEITDSEYFSLRVGGI